MGTGTDGRKPTVPSGAPLGGRPPLCHTGFHVSPAGPCIRTRVGAPCLLPAAAGSAGPLGGGEGGWGQGVISGSGQSLVCAEVGSECGVRPEVGVWTVSKRGLCELGCPPATHVLSETGWTCESRVGALCEEGTWPDGGAKTIAADGSCRLSCYAVYGAGSRSPEDGCALRCPPEMLPGKLECYMRREGARCTLDDGRSGNVAGGQCVAAAADGPASASGNAGVTVNKSRLKSAAGAAADPPWACSDASDHPALRGSGGYIDAQCRPACPPGKDPVDASASGSASSGKVCVPSCPQTPPENGRYLRTGGPCVVVCDRGFELAEGGTKCVPKK